MIPPLLAGLCLAATLAGCGTTRNTRGAGEAWVWTPAERLAMGGSGDSGAMVIPPAREAYPEAMVTEDSYAYARRDEELSRRERTPVGSRPSLNFERRFTTSRNPRSWTYPSRDPYYEFDVYVIPPYRDYPRYPRYPRHRRYPGSPGHTGRRHYWRD